MENFYINKCFVTCLFTVYYSLKCAIIAGTCEFLKIENKKEKSSSFLILHRVVNKMYPNIHLS